MAISAMAVLLAFDVAERAAQSGFRLGRRALSEADQALDRDGFRTLIRSFALAPRGVDPPSVGLAEITGGPEQLEGAAVLARSTPCAEAGPVSRLILRLEHRREEDVVVCQADGGPSILLLHLGRHRLAFSYSADGGAWADRWSDGLPPAAKGAVSSRRLLVRIASADGAVELAEAVESGPPGTFTPAVRAAGGQGF